MHRPIYCMRDDYENWLNLRHTLQNVDKEDVWCANKRIRPSGHNVHTRLFGHIITLHSNRRQKTAFRGYMWNRQHMMVPTPQAHNYGKYDNRKGWYFRFDDDNKMSYHYSDVIMIQMASQITSLMSVYSTVSSGKDQRKNQSSASLAFVRGITGDQWIPRKRTSNAENVSIWWRHHVNISLNGPV